MTTLETGQQKGEVSSVIRYAQIVFVLFASYFILGALVNSVGTVILQAIKTFGVTKKEASVLEAFKDPPIAIMSLLTAAWLPRFGYKKPLALALAAMTLVCILFPLVPTFDMAKVLFITVGSALAVIRITNLSIIGLIAADKRSHMRLMTGIDGFAMIGVVFGFWFFSFFIDPANETSLAWLEAYWYLGAMTAVCLLCVVFTKLPEPEAVAEPPKLKQAFMDMLSLAWKPIVIAFVTTTFLYVLVEQAIATWLPTFNREVVNLSSPLAIQAASIFVFAVAMGRFAASALLKYVAWYSLLNGCVLAMGLTILVTLPLSSQATAGPVITSWADAPIIAWTFPLMGFFAGPIYSTLNSIVLSNLDRSMHAAMIGLLTVFGAIGGVTGSLITGFIFAERGGQQAFYFVLIPLCAILVSMFFMKRLESSQ